jgi:S1-C subfamily serine protease
MNRDEEDLSSENEKDPSPEDFIITEEELEQKERKLQKRKRMIKYVSFIIIFALIVNVWGIFPRIFNIPSIQFLLKSNELSKDNDIQEWKEAVVLISGSQSKGSGFIIHSTGLIVTNFHVIDEMDTIQVSLPDGRIFAAEIMKGEPENDLALLSIKGEQLDLPALTLSKTDKLENYPVYIIGNPLSHSFIVIEGTTEGIVTSSLSEPVLVVDAPIHSGNSGSPVINRDGEVLAVIYAVTNDGKGLAIPVTHVRKLLDLD